MNNLNEKLKQIEQEIKLEIKGEPHLHRKIRLEGLSAQKQLILEVIELVKRRIELLKTLPFDANTKTRMDELKYILGDEK